MDLFDFARDLEIESSSPLAYRIRPTTLEEVVGQEHIIGKGKLLYRAIKADKLSSLILYGPSGTGKTTIAMVIAKTTSCEFREINATTSGKKDMEEIINAAKVTLGMYKRKTILFVDEIHRFNKSQQDYLLPFVEQGIIILIGATTENPFFQVNSALISRSIVVQLKKLNDEDIIILLKRAIADKEKGMGNYNAKATDEALEFFAKNSNGDGRKALNALELGILTTKPNCNGEILIDLDVASDCIQKPVITYEKDGDNHYDTISAFIKSMRGSSPDGAVFYLGKMLYGGEDINFISRRMMIFASEDIGNANPNALVVATNGAMAVERVGMPEARIILSQVASYLASSPKSNSSYLAIDKAMLLAKTRTTVPPHLRDGHYKGANSLGNAIGYKYPHDYYNHYVIQQYLPDEIINETIYEPSDMGYEKEIKKYLHSIKRKGE